MPTEDPVPAALAGEVGPAASRPPLEEIVIRPPDRFRTVDLRELWRYRDTLVTKARQRVRLQYDDMLLGFFWAVARPLIMVLVFWGFRGLSQAKVGVSIPYPLYVYSGLVFWFYFTDATTSVAMSLQKDAGLIQKVYFPRLLSPLSHLLADSYGLLLACVPMAIFMVVFGQYPGWRLALLPLALAQLMALCLGVGMFFSALVLRSRDWERTMKFLFYLGLWLSPVIYAVEMIPERHHLLYLLNPMSGTLLAARSALFEGFAMPWAAWLYSCGVSLAAIALGYFAFERMERTLADRL